MKYRFTTIINKEADWYVARAIELGVVSQGKTIEEAEVNLKEAVELYLEDVEIPQMQLISAPLVTSLEVEYV
ncbi:MAG: type II toxin-antitoxin system HicB family antitoxin [bacterium]|nr:type II toxin-antitoxin system HicB family antitoxin [bacterium]